MAGVDLGLQNICLLFFCNLFPSLGTISSGQLLECPAQDTSISPHGGAGGGGSPPLPGLTFPAALGDFVQDPAQALSRGRCLVFLALDGVSSRILGTGTYTPSSNWICIWRRSSPLNANIPQGSRLGVLMS